MNIFKILEKFIKFKSRTFFEFGRWVEQRSRLLGCHGVANAPEDGTMHTWEDAVLLTTCDFYMSAECLHYDSSFVHAFEAYEHCFWLKFILCLNLNLNLEHVHLVWTVVQVCVMFNNDKLGLYMCENEDQLECTDIGEIYEGCTLATLSLHTASTFGEFEFAHNLCNLK